MTNKDDLFTPVDGVIVEIEKTSNKAGLEIPDEASQKNEGIIISEKIGMTAKVRKEFENISKGSLFEKGKTVKFTEGFSLGKSIYYVRLDKIIGIY